jgi:hypothetical protein
MDWMLNRNTNDELIVKKQIDAHKWGKRLFMKDVCMLRKWGRLKV